jgi:glycosyltransferase involved in cell wall biosynthesis
VTLSRIGVDARLVTTREGGIAEYIRRLIATFKESPPENLHFTILEGRHTPTIPDSTGQFRHIRAQTPAHHRLAGVAFSAELFPHRLDLVHSPDFIPPRFGARLRVITVHDLNFIHYPQYQTEGAKRYYADQIRWAVRVADHILADSQATRIDLINLLGVPESKITVHRLGVHPNYQPLSAEQVDPVLTRYGVTRGYILHVGTIEPRKNWGALFSAYQQLLTRYPDLPPIVAVGNRGWLYEGIFEAAQPLKDRVIWLERVPFADLPALYNGAAVLTMPSFYEGFGFPPLEAMACGIPTVSSNRSSLPEVVGEAGLLIDPDDPSSLADALYLALTDSILRDRLRHAGIAQAGLFRWSETARVTLSVYRQLLEGL